MWKKLCFLLIMTGNACCELIGDHICAVEESFSVNVTEFVLQNVTLREYKWCLNVPPRCSFYTVTKRNISQVVERNDTKVVEECCPGFKENENTHRCVPVCTKCLHGLCTEGSCSCFSGFMGVACDKSCPTTYWGINCKHKCNCTRGACDPQTGFCLCPAGYTGSRCDKECEDGYFGANCNSKCNCNRGLPCNTTSGACLLSYQEGNPETSNIGEFTTKDTRSVHFRNDNIRTPIYAKPTLRLYETFDTIPAPTFPPIFVTVKPTTDLSTPTHGVANFISSTGTENIYQSTTLAPSKDVSSTTKGGSITQLSRVNAKTSSIPNYSYKEGDLSTKANLSSSTESSSLPVNHEATSPRSTAPENIFNPETEETIISTTINTMVLTYKNNGKFLFTEDKFNVNVEHKNDTLMKEKETSESDNYNNNYKNFAEGRKTEMSPLSKSTQATVENNNNLHDDKKYVINPVTENVIKSFRLQEVKNVGSDVSSSSNDFEDNFLNDQAHEQGEGTNDLENNEESLLSSISVSTALAVGLIILAIAIVVLRHFKKKQTNRVAVEESEKNGNVTTVSVPTHSIFHTPLPDPPPIKNPLFSSPSEIKAAECITFETKVTCSMNFPSNQCTKGPQEYLYDHPPSTGSYRAASIPEPPESDINTDCSAMQMEPVYDEIPFRGEVQVPVSQQNINCDTSSTLYINTCGRTRF